MKSTIGKTEHKWSKLDPCMWSEHAARDFRGTKVRELYELYVPFGMARMQRGVDGMWSGEVRRSGDDSLLICNGVITLEEIKDKADDALNDLWERERQWVLSDGFQDFYDVDVRERKEFSGSRKRPPKGTSPMRG